MSSVPSERVHHQPQKKPRGKEAGLGRGSDAVAFTARGSICPPGRGVYAAWVMACFDPSWPILILAVA
jgi:hypothetical protein